MMSFRHVITAVQWGFLGYFIVLNTLYLGFAFIAVWRLRSYMGGRSAAEPVYSDLQMPVPPGVPAYHRPATIAAPVRPLGSVVEGGPIPPFPRLAHGPRPRAGGKGRFPRGLDLVGPAVAGQRGIELPQRLLAMAADGPCRHRGRVERDGPVRLPQAFGEIAGLEAALGQAGPAIGQIGMLLRELAEGLARRREVLQFALADADVEQQVGVLAAGGADLTQQFERARVVAQQAVHGGAQPLDVLVGRLLPAEGLALGDRFGVPALPEFLLD